MAIIRTSPRGTNERAQDSLGGFIALAGPTAPPLPGCIVSDIHIRLLPVLFRSLRIHGKTDLLNAFSRATIMALFVSAP